MEISNEIKTINRTHQTFLLTYNNIIDFYFFYQKQFFIDLKMDAVDFESPFLIRS